MNLSEMAQFICSELGVFDATSVALAKSFLSREYGILWDKYPWVDSQMTDYLNIGPGVNVVDYPTGMDRVITVRGTDVTSEEVDSIGFRSNSRMIEPVSTTFLIESDPSIFERGGNVEFYEEQIDIPTGTKQLRFFPTPVTALSLFILGKAQCPGLSNDTDTIRIRNLENAVIAYAYFDMLQRQRQYGKADLKRKEAVELEQVAWNLEQQQANLPRRTKAITVAGNSLVEMTDSVCALCGQWTQEYRIVIKEFLRRNYQALWDSYLWPESVLAVRVPFITEQVIMPPYVDKVLGVRGTNDFRLSPADGVLLLDISPSVFDETGDPVSFTTLTPVGVSTLPSSTQRLVFSSTSTVDITKVFIRGEIIATGQVLTEEIILQGLTPVTTVNAYDIPITVAKDITVGSVTVNSATDFRSLAVLPSDVRELKHQRLWFLPAPNIEIALGTTDEHFTCLVLAKRVNRPLITDQDTPMITGAQQVLIAAAAGDVFSKLGQNEQAARMSQKAEGAMAVLKAKNMDQAASAPRFVPQVEPRAYLAGVGGCFGW